MRGVGAGNVCSAHAAERAWHFSHIERKGRLRYVGSQRPTPFLERALKSLALS